MRHIDRCIWDSFCQQYKKTEKGMKSFLFKEKLSEKEFETLIDCSRYAFTNFAYYYIDYGKLFTSCPRLIECCNWTRLDELSWTVLLSQKPEFADKCNKWDEFDGDDWSDLLAKQPQFADKCGWDKLDGSAWGYLLSEQPQFADKCDVWDYLDAAQWESLLKHQPQLVDKCAKSSIVVNVLIKHPQFTEHCNTSIITEKGKAKLLAKHPNLVKYFPKRTETKVPKKSK